MIYYIGEVNMGKLKTAICPGCGKPINGHDANRIVLKLVNSPKGTKVTYHLKCYQETGI